MSKKKKIIIRLLTVFAIISALILGYFFFIKPIFEKQDEEEMIKQEQQDFLDLVHEFESVSSDGNKPYEFIKKYDNMVGWIKIPKTGFSYPVMYTGPTEDQDQAEFYLHRDVNDKYSFCGTPFIDARCDPMSSDNLIIYGHNISGRRHFGFLHNYRDEAFYEKHPDIYYSDADKKHHYEILSVIETTIHSSIYNFIDIGNKDDYTDGLKRILDESMYETTTAKKLEKLIKKDRITVSKPDKKHVHPNLLTLSTCRTYAGSDNRLLIIAMET